MLITLTAAIVNAGFMFFTFLLTLPIIILPANRKCLRVQGWAAVFCAIFTLVIGLVIWFSTLKTRANLSVIWGQQDLTRQSLLQERFNCCGYLDASTPPFVTDSTCPNQLAAIQMQGCAGPFSSFANGYLDVIFTAAFGVVGIDVLMLICVAMLIKRKQELERYRYIDEKVNMGDFRDSK